MVSSTPEVALVIIDMLAPGHAVLAFTAVVSPNMGNEKSRRHGHFNGKMLELGGV